MQFGIHFQKVDEVGHLVNASTNTQWVLVVDPSAENQFPGKKVVGRFCDELEQELVPQGARGAEIWWERNGGRVAAVLYLCAVKVCNEPQGLPATINEYMDKWVTICNTRHPGLKTVVGNFSVGTPVVSTAPQFASSIHKADYLGFHVYWVPELWEPQYAWAETEVFYRYKGFMANLPKDLQGKPILITEVGCDGLINCVTGKPNTETGWVDYYGANRWAYVTDAQKWASKVDDRVKAAFMYTAGPWPRWYWYIVDKPLAELLLATNVKEEEVKLNEIRVGFPDGKVVTMDIEEYVRGVIPLEVYTSWPMAALEAQAVAARSYALYCKATNKHKTFDVCTTQHCQMYGAGRSTRANEAVANTAGIVGVNKKTKMVAAMFFSVSCGGQTHNTWGDWLRATECLCGEHDKPVNGHQQGMCQWGAYYMSKDGSTWQQIIDHYYDVALTTDYGAGTVIETGSDVVGVLVTNIENKLKEVNLLVSQLRDIVVM